MVTVTDISTIRSSACVLLDNGEKYWLRRDDLPAAGIREGLSCEPGVWARRADRARPVRGKARLPSVLTM